MDQPVWEPNSAYIDHSTTWRFIAWLAHESCGPAKFTPARAQAREAWEQLYAWSIAEPGLFWQAWARYCGVVAESDYEGGPWADAGWRLDQMAPPRPEVGPWWFPRARLNFAENLVRNASQPEAAGNVAIEQWHEHGLSQKLTCAELVQGVCQLARALKQDGVGPGCRVAGFLPNIAEAVIAMLAATSIGAIWTSCSPDFGTNGVLDRFGQVTPTVLFATPGYIYGGKYISIEDKLAQISSALPDLQRLVLVPYPQAPVHQADAAHAIAWDAYLNTPQDEAARAEETDSAVSFTRFPFNHPLVILYSSGTTGLPKCMVHGAGGTLLQHLKELALHSDVRAGDRVFYFTTCGWMMWNWLVSSLALGATLVLFDGNPLKPDPRVLWRMAEQARVTHFGASAKYLALLEKEGVRPDREFELDALRVVLSTGSPLAPESFDYVYREIKPEVQLASISGGTDIISCFALGNPLAPVYRGQLQTRGLGMAVEVWNSEGAPVTGEPGELVCTRPFPSMPVSFWNDPDGAKYRHAYFEHFLGVWRHGDWVELTAQGGLIIYGRSDATLNPGGVRIGTAEIYQQVEAFPEILESIAIGQDWDGDTRIVLFVRLADGAVLTDELAARLRQRIREQCSPHHVPRKLIAVADIPRTLNGKLSESAVRAVVHGQVVTNRDALANPEALENYRGLIELET